MTVDNAKVALGSPAHVTVTLKDHYAVGSRQPGSGQSGEPYRFGGSLDHLPRQATTDSGAQAIFIVMDSMAEVVTYSATDTTDMSR